MTKTRDVGVMTSAGVSTAASILDQVHDIGRQVIAPAAGDVDRLARFPSEGIDALKKLGLLSAYVPRELGGMGLDVVEICAHLRRARPATADRPR